MHPPLWLEQNDEGWGPTDLRKRRSPEADKIPRREVPARSFGGLFFTVLLVLIAVATILVLGLYGWALISRLVGSGP